MIFFNNDNYSNALAEQGKLANIVAQKYGKDSFETETAVFIEEFLNQEEYVKVHTSGSTGIPKEILAKKKYMCASAYMTCDFLKLNRGDNALLCMSLKHIAGKMMVVRALLRELNLITVKPCANPFLHAPLNLDFAAITPMQAFCALNDPTSAKIMGTCKKIIIGGGPIDKNLHARLIKLPNVIYHSYGMTETLSHIALKRLDDDFYKPFTPLSNVYVSLSDKGTLIIKALHVCEKILETNDIAKINNDGFTILGRIDNIINSGAIKLIPEVIEDKLQKVIPEKLAITSAFSEKYGEEVVLVIERKISDEILKKAYLTLDKYEKPKRVIVTSIPLTETQKIDRKSLKAKIQA